MNVCKVESIVLKEIDFSVEEGLLGGTWPWRGSVEDMVPMFILYGGVFVKSGILDGIGRGGRKQLK